MWIYPGDLEQSKLCFANGIHRQARVITDVQLLPFEWLELSYTPNMDWNLKILESCWDVQHIHEEEQFREEYLEFKLHVEENCDSKTPGSF